MATLKKVLASMSRIFSILVIVFVILFVFAIVVAYFEGHPRAPIQPKKINIGFNFLVVPLSQATPRVFAGGLWQELPLSQVSLISQENKMMGTCGDGGFYIYDLNSHQLKYLYSEKWFPCTSISFEGDKIIVYSGTSNAYPVVYDSEKPQRKIFDIAIGKLLSSDDVTYKDVGGSFGQLLKFKNDFRKNDFRSVCDAGTGFCAKLIDGGSIGIYNGDAKTGDIDSKKASAVLAFKDGILLYATEEGSCGGRARSYWDNTRQYLESSFLFVNKAYGCRANNYLHAYDVEKKVDEVLLKDFRFDGEVIVFF